MGKGIRKKLTIAEKEAKKGILLKLSSSMLIDKNVRNSCNAGYLFLQDIYYPLGLDKICTSISKNKFDYDLNDILSMLFHSRIIAPGSNLSSLESAKRFLEQPKCELHQVYRALEVIANENDFFQSELYKSSQNVINKKKKSFITTAPTTTLRLKTKMILENMVFPKNTDLTLLFRWVCLWMRIAFHLHSLFLMAIKTSSLLCLLWSKRLLKTSKPLTLSYVRMPVFLRLPTENSTVSKAEDLLQHSLLKS